MANDNTVRTYGDDSIKKSIGGRNKKPIENKKQMPKVGNKKFPYTKKGIATAKKVAAKMGEPMKKMMAMKKKVMKKMYA